MTTNNDPQDPNVELSKDEVTKIIKLSSLDARLEDVQSLTENFNAILNYVKTLQRVETASTVATSHVYGTTNVLREDVVLPSMPPEDGLLNAPDVIGQFFRVPLVVEG